MDEKEIIRDIQIVCKCKVIKYRAIRQAIENGADTIEKVRMKTRANTGCGKRCTPKILEMIELHKKK